MTWWDRITDKLNDGWKSAKTFVEQKALPVVEHVAVDAWDKTKEYAPKVWNEIKKDAPIVWDTTKRYAPVVYNEAKHDATVIYNSVDKGFHETIDVLKKGAVGVEQWGEHTLHSAESMITKPFMMLGAGALAILAVSMMRK